MRLAYKHFLYFLLAILLIAGCSSPEENQTKKTFNTSKGSLFIIGGGKRPPEMIQKMIATAGLSAGDSIVILPWASSEPDSSSYYAKKQFEAQGFGSFIDLQPAALDSLSPQARKRVASAPLIYIPGGDQRRFMETAAKYSMDTLLRHAYANGSMIAGTSAGAAIMSRPMITGTALKYEAYHPTFRTLETDNLELDMGIGLLPDSIIVDQHFVWRSRYNRLLTAVIENPSWTGWGIEESTAVLVQGDTCTVVGKYQVVLFKNRSKTSRKDAGLLGEEDIQLSILLPGDRFSLY